MCRVGYGGAFRLVDSSATLRRSACAVFSRPAARLDSPESSLYNPRALPSPAIRAGAAPR